MLKKSVYLTQPIAMSMQDSMIRYLLIFCSLIAVFFSQKSYAQEEDLEYYEISIFLSVSKMGGGEIDAVIKGNVVYLPITYLFDFLKIKNTPSPGFEYVEGFFINKEASYRIDRLENNITYAGKSYDLDTDALIQTEYNLYLRADYYGKVFGLDCEFNFRSLSVTLNPRVELPVLREMRLAEMRKNINRLKGNIKVDTTYGRIFPLHRFGTADWSVFSQQEIGGKKETRMNLTLGQIVAGGEATISLNYDSNKPIIGKQQHYIWRRVNNDSKYVRQIMAGKIVSQATSSIFEPVIGLKLTNTPTTFRRSFGTYTLSDITEPGWVVELYVNNILVDYVKSDASGLFTFEVPLVYGNSLIMLKFYGPWGEERSSERNITIPYNFLPKNKLEYNFSAGMVEDTLSSRFSRTSVNYGLTNKMTIGAGYEYLSSVTSGAMMPFVNTSFSLTSNLLMSIDYAHSVRTKASLSYRFPSTKKNLKARFLQMKMSLNRSEIMILNIEKPMTFRWLRILKSQHKPLKNRQRLLKVY